MKEIKTLIKKIKSQKKQKKICFFLGNTKKIESKTYYITPVRENKSFIFFSAIVYNDYIAKKILKILDGEVDIILVDIEKKVQSKSKSLGLVNIERTAKDNVKKSKLYIYKANDLTINAAETLLFNLFLKDKRGIGGKKILIIGVGNIGFKLALKFVESGSEIYIYRRNLEILKNIEQTINHIKPQGTKSKVRFLKNFPKNFDLYDVIICAANKKNIIKFSHVNKLKKKNIFIDIGKGNFENNAIKILNEKKINIYRLDATSSFFSYLENLDFTEKHYNTKNLKRKIDNITFVLRGVVGQKNDLIVDNVKEPTKVYGVCDGEGGLMIHDFIDKQKIIKKIKKLIKKNLSYE